MTYYSELKAENLAREKANEFLEYRKILVQNIIDKYNKHGEDFYNAMQATINSYPSKINKFHENIFEKL